MRIKDALSSSTKREREWLWHFSSKKWRVMETSGQWESQCWYPCWAVLTFCWGEPTSLGPLMMLWEPDRFSNEHIFLGLVRIGPVIKKFILNNLPGSQIGWFSYIHTTTDFHDLVIINFSLIKISNAFVLTAFISFGQFSIFWKRVIY